MPNIQIFVEDELNEAYEILAAKAIGAPVHRSRVSGAHRIRASRVTLDELTRFEILLDLMPTLTTQWLPAGCICHRPRRAWS
jgi:hypothetical protein